MTFRNVPAPDSKTQRAVYNPANAPEAPPEFPEDLPELFCNLVMKGGVTSGIVFPGAIRVLATRYRFRHIGGTSAGAIAAAFTAAAEYYRREQPSGNGRHKGFETIWKQSDELSQRPEQGKSTSARTRLEALFAPNDGTRKTYELISALASVESRQKKNLDADSNVRRRRTAFAGQLVCALLKTHPLPTGVTGLGALLTVGGAAWWLSSGRATGSAALMLAGTWVAGGGAASLLKSTLVDGLKRLNDNGFGLSRGFEPEAVDEPERFTEWMHRNLQQISGLNTSGILTFGHLAPRHYELERDPRAIFDAQSTKQRGLNDRLKYGNISLEERRLFRDYVASDIDLKQVVTNLTFGRPYTFPFNHSTTDDRNFYFKEDELRKYFPEEIIDHLCAYSELKIQLVSDKEPYYRLPPAQHLPILISTRMSMSFPGLFTPVPMYYASWIKFPDNPDELHEGEAFKRTLPKGWKPEPAGRARIERVYFGDGGLTSNFPLGLFDDLIPAEPTFGLNLTYPKRPVNAETGTPIQKDFGDGQLLRPVLLKEPNERDKDGNNTWTTARNTFNSLFGYGLAILESARNWSDNSLLNLPGYTERIAHINLTGSLGGTNLAMDADQMTELRRRGMIAGYSLIYRFSGNELIDYRGSDETSWNTPWSWDIHQANSFIRLTADLEKLLQEYALAYKDPVANGLCPAMKRALAQVRLQNAAPFAPLDGSLPGGTKIDQLISLGASHTQLRGYRKLRGKRSVLKYRPNF
ncbi:patatin-like phospholipase family protein [Deinococcus aquatilis]|uniref:patatin-like phospholipase family protein n=1 Tax=Deinococcus aquatilis TaxID=519440 RepID=UPI0003A5BA39|nr:patatin-like phospholipase family protein [Deinococcus aquatilis]